MKLLTNAKILENGELKTTSILIEGKNIKTNDTQIKELMKEGTELYLLWNDKQYQNNLDGNEISEEELIKIAESLYKNEK